MVLARLLYDRIGWKKLAEKNSKKEQGYLQIVKRFSDRIYSFRSLKRIQ